MQDAEQAGESWQEQAQAAVQQAARLTELLAEGAQWPPGTPTAATPRAGDVAAPDGSLAPQSGGNDAQGGAGYAAAQDSPAAAQQGSAAQCAVCRTKDAQIATQTAKAAEYDTHVRALQMEVLRATNMSAQVGRSVLPVLYSIESRLLEQA